MGRSCERRVSFREVAQLMAEHLDELSGKFQSRIEARLLLPAGALSHVLMLLDLQLKPKGGLVAVTLDAALDELSQMLRARFLPSLSAQATPRVAPVTPRPPRIPGRPRIVTEPPMRPNHTSRRCAFSALREALCIDAKDMPAAPAGPRCGPSLASAKRRSIVERQRQCKQSSRNSSRSSDASNRSTEYRSSGSGSQSSSRSCSPFTSPFASPYASPREASGGRSNSSPRTVQSPRLPESARKVHCMRELRELLAKKQGAQFLCLERPRTSAVGSWGIGHAFENLAAARGVSGCIRTSVLMGASAKQVAVRLRTEDSPCVVAQQWQALKSAFMLPRSVLLFHLTNHYALIYAWREWQDETSSPGRGAAPTIRRQILAARRGQRPSAWIDFEEMRNIMLRWTGYNLLQFERTDRAQSETR
jgi:hypothetical protein